MENKDKIIIVGDIYGMDISGLMAKYPNIEVVDFKEATERELIPERVRMPIVAPLVFDMPFQPPLTRAELRKLARKK